MLHLRRDHPRATERLRRPWVRAVVAVAALAATAAGGYLLGSRATTAGGPAVASSATSQAVTASLSTLERSVTATGTLAPTVQEDVSFAVSGTVTAVAVATGDTVTAGQTLATVDTLELRVSLLEATATLASARARLDEAESADDDSDAADAQVAAAAAQVEVAEAAVATATDAMSDATLTAPVGGLVTSIDLEVGDVVSGGGSAQAAGGGTGTSSAQVVIVGTDSWQVELTVDESDVAQLEAGDQAEIAVDGVVDTVFGTVSEVGLVSTSTSGVAAYPVVVAVTGSPDGLHDGASADVTIIYERRVDVLTVPSAAVRTVDGSSVVTQRAADGSEVTTEVTAGETVDDVTEITAGLAEGDEVLVTAVQRQPSDSDTSDSGDQSQMPGGGFPGVGEMPGAGQAPGVGGDG